MDHTRDNPLKRFKAFWIALLLVFSFGVALILLRPLTHQDGESAMDVTAKARLAVKQEVDRAQAEALDAGALQKAIDEQLKTFAQNTKSKGAMPVPGAAPAPAKPAEPAPAADQPAKPAPAVTE
jgi:hypothetical protein